MSSHLGFFRELIELEVRDLVFLSVGGLNILTLFELELLEVDGDGALALGLKEFSRITLSGRTKLPCFCLHLKYRCPPTLPSCLP